MGKHFVLCEAETDLGVESRNTAHSVVGPQEVEM
jgi:hypothetical protein